MTLASISIGDRVRLIAHKDAPVMAVASLFLQGEREELWASCTWLKGAQRVYVAVGDLVAA